MSKDITWTIRVKCNTVKRSYWGEGLESCWRKLRLISVNGNVSITLKILYHGECLPPQKVAAGPEPFTDVAVFFNPLCDDNRHQWFARSVDSTKICNCSNWNTSQIDQFISYYTE